MGEPVHSVTPTPKPARAPSPANPTERTPAPEEPFHWTRLEPGFDLGSIRVLAQDRDPTIAGASRPLPGGLRDELEPLFGRRLDQIRVHTGEGAARLAEAFDAKAFTVGNRIVFGAGGWAPETPRGRLLLAHELAHTGQPPSGGPILSSADQASERQAEVAAARVARGEPAGVGRTAFRPLISRADENFDDSDRAYRENTPSELIGFYTSFVFLKAGQLADALKRRLFEGAFTYVLDTFDKLGESDRDDVALALTRQIGDAQLVGLTTVEGGRKVLERLRVELLSGSVRDVERQEAARIAKAENQVSPERREADRKSVRESPSGKAEAQVAPKELINQFTIFPNLLEEKLGEALVKRADKGAYEYVQNVLDLLSSTDRDDVSLGFSENANDGQLARYAGSKTGRVMLSRLVDELSAGSVWEDEQQQITRIKQALNRSTPPKALEEAPQKALLFPFQSPRVTGSSSVVSAERIGNGYIKVHMAALTYGSYPETLRLPVALFTRGLVLPEDQIVAVKLYDEGGQIVYQPAIYLVELSNRATKEALEKAGEVAAIGLTLPVGGAGAGAVELTTLARVALWADRAATAIGFITSVIREHRGEIIARYGESGRRFVNATDTVSAFVGFYGLARVAISVPRVFKELRAAYGAWRRNAAARRIQNLMDASEEQVVIRLTKDTEQMLADVDEVEKRAAAARPGAPVAEEGEAGEAVDRAMAKRGASPQGGRTSGGSTKREPYPERFPPTRFVLDFFRDLSKKAQRLVKRLIKERSAEIGEIAVEDLVKISIWFDSEVAVVQNLKNGRLRLILGEPTGMPAGVLGPGEVYLVHTHPSVRPIKEHFEGIDLKGATERVEGVIDWAGNKLFFQRIEGQGRVLNPADRLGTLQPLGLDFRPGFFDRAQTTIIGYSKTMLAKLAGGT